MLFNKVFLQENEWPFWRVAKKSDCITKVVVRRGSTVHTVKTTQKLKTKNYVGS